MISVYSIHVHVHVGVVELCCVSLYIGRCLEVCLSCIYILGLEFGVFGGLITPVCSLILS